MPLLTIDKLQQIHTMGTNRKQRSKSEGTFLDSVKGLLTHLSKEVADIKSAVSEMHFLYSFTAANQSNWFYNGYDLDSWRTWEALGYQNSSMPVATSGDNAKLGCSVDSLAATPPGADALSRELLLQFRQGQHDLWRPLELCTLSICKSTEQSYRLWQPCPKSRFIQPGSLTHMELESDAATVVQKWYRALNSSVTDDSDHDGTECESLDIGGGTSVEQLSIRRAFLLSNTMTAPSAHRSGDSSIDAWTKDQVMHWLGNAIDRAREPEDRVQGARTMWNEWASASPHLPDDMHQSIVRLIDQKLCSTGFPSLRELVQLQDG